jgi:dihydroorotate dehydrogenase electron transfer subunit
MRNLLNYEEKQKFGIKTVEIKKIIQESEDIKTFFFNINKNNNFKNSKPRAGQFVMVWVPGVDEKPMSISGYDEEGNWSITVKNVGDFTNKIHNLKIGDTIGIKGPLGNHFILPKYKRKIILIGGGIGIAPLKCLAEELNKKNITYDVIQGATCHNRIIFKEFFETNKEKIDELLFCTEEGISENRGNAAEIFQKYIQKHSNEKNQNYIIYTCGPEKMLYKIFKICEKYGFEMQASLERKIKCGCGICGSCTLDPLGLLVCKDGPIFNSEILRKTEDFGHYKRDFAGNKIKI